MPGCFEKPYLCKGLKIKPFPVFPFDIETEICLCRASPSMDVFRGTDNGAIAALKLGNLAKSIQKRFLKFVLP